jgi:hypothetical protein
VIVQPAVAVEYVTAPAEDPPDVLNDRLVPKVPDVVVMLRTDWVPLLNVKVSIELVALS